MKLVRKSELNNPFQNKSLKKLIDEVGYTHYAKYMLLYYALKTRKENKINETNIAEVSAMAGIEDLEIPLLLYLFENIYPPLIETKDESQIFLSLKEDKEQLKERPIEIRLTDKEKELLLADLSLGEFDYICQEVLDWLSESKRGRGRESHYRTIRTFLRNKKAKGLIYTARHENGAGYYPEYIVKKIQG